jgi:tRNA(Ile)-lysidine synthase
MIETFIQHIAHKSLLDPQKPYLLACSGGIDSMCLGTLLLLSGIPFEIAHVNFGLRSKESEGDEIFVREWAESIKKTIHVIHPETDAFARLNHVSTQMAAREIRYEWFEKIRSERQLAGIILAHHEDDQLETIFLNLLRGTGIEGIYGMADRRGWLIRPLLPFSREEILQFATEKGVKWREDSSNTKTDYKRNKLRLLALPSLYDVAEDAKSSIQTSFSRLRDTGKAFAALAEIWQNQHIRHEDGLQYLPISPLTNMPGAGSLLYFWLRSYGFNSSQIQDILASSFRPETGAIFESTTHLLNLDRESLILGPKTACFEPLTLQYEDQEIMLPEEKYSLTILDGQFDLDKNPKHAMLDLELLKFPLLIRTWEEGDRFVPIGMKTSKKISDFLIDLKVPLLKKKNIKVLVSEGEIAWVFGLRVSDWAKCTASTRKIFYIKKTNP